MSDTTLPKEQPGASITGAASPSVSANGGAGRRTFSGTISTADGRVVLTAGGLAAEVLAADTVPADEKSLERERARTRTLFARQDGRSVTLRGAQRGGFISGAALRGAEARPAARLLDEATREQFAGVYRAIDEHRDELLRIPGVVSVRPGYRFERGWITGEPAVVVTVLRKRPEGELGGAAEIVPRGYGDVRVDVTPASPIEQLRAAAAAGTESAAAMLASLGQASAEPGLSLLAAAEAQGATETFNAGSEALADIKYRPPDDVALEEVTDAMTLTCHASPDAGWPTLSEFLERTSERLTIAMYDFTAPHIVRGVRSAMSHADGDLQLILGRGESLPKPDDTDSTKADDLPESKVISRLRNALHARLRSVWASVGNPNGLFANSYHIKVVVRDGRAFWLSSGNLQSSNQPDLNPLGADADVPGILHEYNREWHVIVEHPGLARTFERFIEWDIEQSRKAPAPESLGAAAAPAALPELLVPAPSAEALPRYFPPARMNFNSSKKLRVQPLLTPDNYAEEVLRLIESAEEKVYFQNQSIGFAKNNYEDFLALVDALRRKMDDGLDVRVIMRGDFGPRVMLENLVARGFHPQKVKFQPNCHNKGIVVDSRAVLVSSHNWTNSGTLFNRDAGLIFHDARVARYYEEIFLHDWERLASHLVTHEVAAPMVAGLARAAGEGAETPGYVRVPWNVYYED